MRHSDQDPATDCGGTLIGKADLVNRGGRAVHCWECDSCHAVDNPLIRRRLERVWRRLVRSDRFQRLQVRRCHMKLRLSVQRKAGAPGYGSDGCGAEIEVDIDYEDPQDLVSAAAVYYRGLELAVDAQLVRMQAMHPPVQQAAQSAAVPAHNGHGHGHNPDHVRPVARPEPPPEPPFDECQGDPEPRAWSPPPPRQRTRPADADGNGGGPTGKPRNGKQLLGWANRSGAYDRLMTLAKDADRGKVVEWSDEMVAWAYQELTRPKPAGAWGGRN